MFFCVLQNGAKRVSIFILYNISLKNNIVQRLHQNHCVDFINKLEFILFHFHDILIKFQPSFFRFYDNS